MDPFIERSLAINKARVAIRRLNELESKVQEVSRELEGKKEDLRLTTEEFNRKEILLGELNSVVLSKSLELDSLNTGVSKKSESLGNLTTELSQLESSIRILKENYKSQLQEREAMLNKELSSLLGSKLELTGSVSKLKSEKKSLDRVILRTVAEIKNSKLELEHVNQEKKTKEEAILAEDKRIDARMAQANKTEKRLNLYHERLQRYAKKLGVQLK